MKYNVTNMNEEILKQILNWKYDGKYSEYDLEPYEVLKQRNSSITRQEKASNYLCFCDKGMLIGYTNLAQKDNGKLFLGIGLAPEYCGKGLGKEILKYTLNRARDKYKDKKIVLQVRSWNERAINCYKKSGFKIVKKERVENYKGDIVEYVFMEYNL